MPVDTFFYRAVVEAIFRDRYGRITSQSITPNLRVNGGADFWNTQIFSASPGGAGANYIGLTTDSTAPGATDTVLTSEESTNGLARAQGTLTHTAGTSSSQLSHTWTYTGSSSKVIAKVGLFNAASNGTMVAETLLGTTGTVNTNGDTIIVNWAFNF